MLNEQAQAEYKERLMMAQHVAPETEGVMVDGQGNWYGYCGAYRVPTTRLVGPDGDRKPRAWKD